MIKDFLKNICLITFALVGPITLPAGGIQRNLIDYQSFNNSKEIVLNSNCSLFTYPKQNAKKLMLLNPGTSLSILRQWKVDETNVWLRVEISRNKFIDDPNNVSKGWIKI